MNAHNSGADVIEQGAPLEALTLATSTVQVGDETSLTGAPGDAPSTDIELSGTAAAEKTESELNSNSVPDELGAEGYGETEVNNETTRPAAEHNIVARNSLPAADPVPGAEISGDDITAPTCPASVTAEVPAATDAVAVTFSGVLLEKRPGDQTILGSTSRVPDGQLSVSTSHAPVRRTEVPDKILAKLYPNAQVAMRIICERPPVVAGQNPGFYFDLLEVALEDWRPGTLQECSLVKQMVDAEWALLMFQEFQTWLIRTAMANDVLVQLADLKAEANGNEAANKIPSGRERGEPGAELFFRGGLWRKIRSAVFAAVAGDPDAIAFVEQEIGPGRVAIGPQTAKHFEPAFPAHQFADRAINARIAWRDAANCQLQKLRVERLQRKEAHQRNAADIRAEFSLSEYAALLGDRATMWKIDANAATSAEPLRGSDTLVTVHAPDKPGSVK